MSIVISVISGKGGCGKSLLTAVLGRAISREGERVLLIDMDIFVRGLTVLLHQFRKKSSNTGNITTSEVLGVYSQNSEQIKPKIFQKSDLLIHRFYECDILPAVKNIGDPLDYSDRDLSDEQFCYHQLKLLLDALRQDYDYIFLDNRAGMDSLIMASCMVSDMVLTIAEDDEVGRQTNVNVINYLKYRKDIKHIYSILNKGRKITSYKDVKSRHFYRHEFNFIGVIPFDIEVMEDFGSDRFWFSINETLYFRALIDSWNGLADLEGMQPISERKYKFPPKIFMDRSQGRYSLIERILRLYSIIFLAGGVFTWAYSKKIFIEKLSTIDQMALLSIIIGVLALILSTSGIRVFLLGQAEKKKED